MKYRVTIDGQEREIDVQLTPGGSVSVMMDGAALDVDALRIPGGVSLRVGTKTYDVMVGESGGGLQLAAGELRTKAVVESERNKARKKRGGGGSSEKEIRAPMPGRVVKVLVSVGDEVEADAPVVVIEAMKMENELRAPTAAKVAAIEASEGQNVEGGALLVRFE